MFLLLHMINEETEIVFFFNVSVASKFRLTEIISISRSAFERGMKASEILL